MQRTPETCSFAHSVSLHLWLGVWVHGGERLETSVLFACFGDIYDTMNYEAGEGRVSVSIYMDW